MPRASSTRVLIVMQLGKKIHGNRSRSHKSVKTETGSSHLWRRSRTGAAALTWTPPPTPLRPPTASRTSALSWIGRIQPAPLRPRPPLAHSVAGPSAGGGEKGGGKEKRVVSLSDLSTAVAVAMQQQGSTTITDSSFGDVCTQWECGVIVLPVALCLWL